MLTVMLFRVSRRHDRSLIYKKDYLLKEVSRIVVDEFGAIDNSMIMYDSLLLKHIIISDMKGYDL